MAQAALFSVIGGALVNLAKVTHIENSTIDKGKVMVHFDNKDVVVLDGSMESVLLKIGGSRDDLSQENPRYKKPAPTSMPGDPERH